VLVQAQGLDNTAKNLQVAKELFFAILYTKCAQKERQSKVSIKLETLRSWVRCVTITLTSCA